MIKTSISWNRHTRFAQTAGEHNARLLAMRDQASFEKNMFALIDLGVCDYARSDGFGSSNFEFSGKAEVSAIHAALAHQFAAEHGVPMFRAFEATGHTAFQKWDEVKAQEVAA